MNAFDYNPQIERILRAASFRVSTILPSEFNELYRSMDSSVSSRPGQFRYDQTPYLREIVDSLSSEHPLRQGAIMKGAQLGFSVGVIEAGIVYIISEQPGNILFLTGHMDLSEEAVAKVDHAIDSCGLRSLIKSNIQRSRNTKTGDTNTKKEFPGGSLISGSAGNHKLLRQRSMMYGFIDDFEAAKQLDKKSGSTKEMIDMRFSSYGKKKKVLYISTPELLSSSNINPAYLEGDQRKWHIPCPCCGELITLEWETDGHIEGTKAGMYWELNEKNRLIPDSVGYICQKCGGFFDESHKYELNLHGRWIPTEEPFMDGYFSWQISNLYAPSWMDGWTKYVYQYLKANPPNGSQDEGLHQTFVNLVLGLPYEPRAKSISAAELQKNVTNYEIGTIPETLSINHGNGSFVLLTLAADMNGLENDARLDWEILGWTESGATYSIKHGSIGTFIPNEAAMKNKVDRERWTYEHHRPNSVWGELNKILGEFYVTDTGRRMKIFMSGLDCGHYTNFAYDYIDTSNFNIVGLKGDKEDKIILNNADLPKFKPARERPNLYLVQVGHIKDEIAAHIALKWDVNNDATQPYGYMNYPMPSDGLYQYNNYFAHYESEERAIINKDGKPVAFIWKKKSTRHYNHMFDCRVYNVAVKNILVNKICKELKILNYTWKDFVDVILKR